jgi:GNAT superfamily N-acetyltransferase
VTFRVIAAVSRQHRETLRALHTLTFPYDDHEDYESGRWWLVLDGYEPVGFAGLRQALTEPAALYFSRCGVLASHRGQGIQKQLLRKRMSYARTRTDAAACISTTYKNTASANNLIRAGFRLYDPESPWGSDGTLYWRKELK